MPDSKVTTIKQYFCVIFWYSLVYKRYSLKDCLLHHFFSLILLSISAISPSLILTTEILIYTFF